MARPALLCTLAAVLAASGPCPAQDEAGLARGLDWVQSLMAQGRWSSAKIRLLELLDEHQGTDHARARRTEIAEAFKRCRFYLVHRPPAARDLIHGALVRHSRRNGTIALRYGPRTLGDFAYQPGTGALFHPIDFTGPYTLTMKGRRYPSSRGGVQLFVCDSGDSVTGVVLGQQASRTASGVAMMITRLERQGQTELTPIQNSPAVPGEPWVAQVAVGAASIQVYYNGALVMQAAKPRDVWGHVGFVKTDFTELLIEGKADSSWLQSKIDATMQQKLAAFEREYDERAELPGWLFEAPDTGSEAALPAKSYPGRILPRHVPALSAASELVNAERFAEALEYVEGLPRTDISSPARSFLIAVCRYRLGDPEAALPPCNAASREDPGFADTRHLRARILVDLRRTDEAIADLQWVLQQQPDDGSAYHSLAMLLLELGRPDDAMGVVQRARQSGADVPELDDLDRKLAMALHGPDWHRTFEYQSTHYHVFSDVDHRTCVQAARLLEQVYATYQAQLARVHGRTERFRVYIFGGEASYQKYCALALGSVLPHTKGLYSPSLKQLLVRNLSDQQDMLETVRHEGFHQYLDRVMREPPAWFNEGLALYYETASHVNGRVQLGEVRDDLVALLHPDRITPLRELLTLSLERFYRNPELNYAQSWALVHFLRHGKRKHRLLFGAIFEALRQDVSNQEAMRAAFDGLSVDDVDAEFRQYVLDLRSRVRATPR